MEESGVGSAFVLISFVLQFLKLLLVLIEIVVSAGAARDRICSHFFGRESGQENRNVPSLEGDSSIWDIALRRDWLSSSNAGFSSRPWL